MTSKLDPDTLAQQQALDRIGNQAAREFDEEQTDRRARRAAIRDEAATAYDIALGLAIKGDLEPMITAYAALQRRMATDKIHLGKMEQKIVELMGAHNATVVEHPTQDVKITQQIMWDKSKLFPLRELVSPGMLAEAYVPAHEETIQVQESWNMTKVKPLTHLGKEVQAVLDAAQYLGAPRLSIKPKLDAR